MSPDAAGYSILSAPGTILCVGIPFWVVLIVNLTGIAGSTDLKNISTLLANIPPSLSIKIVSATGSTHVVVSDTCESTIVLSSFNSVCTSLGTFVDTILLSTDSRRPWAWYCVSAYVVSFVLLFVLLSVSLNSLTPVANLSALFLGIINEPDTCPVASVIKLPAESGCDVTPSKVSTPDWSENSWYVSSLIKLDISTPSKNAYIFSYLVSLIEL